MALTTPVVVSFYAGAEYYHRAATILRADCVRLGVAHDIVELPAGESDTWIDLCRRKIPFLQEMQHKHQCPVLWLDVDCRLLQPISPLGVDVDLGLFVRGFRYLRDADPVMLPRLWQPSIIFLNFNARTVEFVNLMADIELTSGDVATDDYFLQEAWVRHTSALSILVLRPDMVCESLPAPASAKFLFGRSGQVTEHKSKALQHTSPLFEGSRRKAVFMQAGAQAGQAKRLDEALVMLRKAFEIDHADEALALRIARLLRRMKRLPDALEFLGGLPTDKSNLSAVFQIDAALDEGHVKTAHGLAEEMIRTGTAQDIAWAQSRMVRIQLDLRALQAGLKQGDRPALWWMEGPYPGNFGDILNPYIVEKLSGVPPRFVARNKGMLAIGSTIKFAAEGTPVWGTGTPRMTDRLDPKADYRAVRGPLTRQLVLESGGQCPEVYGDPAWFLPRIYQPTKIDRRFKLGLVCHFSNEEDLSVGMGVKRLPVLCVGYEGIENFIDALHDCERILSTSLHGLIVAHAYGIPARWCHVEDAVVALPGDGTKFLDYCLSVGLEDETPLRFTRGQTVGLEQYEAAFRLPNNQIDLERLSEVAPFDITADWQNPARG